MFNRFKQVLVTGGAGYVGSVLVPKLLARDFGVRVLDLFLYGEDVLDASRNDPRLQLIKGDLRHLPTVEAALAGCDAVIHLACISNDPSFELDPELGRSINLDAFRPLVRASKAAGVRRFIYASSSSVYGIKEVSSVTEDLPLLPLTDYSKFKAECEKILREEQAPGFVTLTLRPATICGYSPRQRLDVVVNILTSHAVHNGKIKVFGGGQLRPNLHIEDMTDLYVQCLDAPDEQIDGRIWNAGYENRTVTELAETVRDVVGGPIALEVVPTDDNRSYHVSSERIRREFGFAPQYTIADAVSELNAAFKDGRIPDAMSNSRYYNIRVMQEARLK